MVEGWAPERMLSPKGVKVLEAISDAALRVRVTDALKAVGQSLERMDGLDLSRYEQADLDMPDLSIWNEAAPAVGATLAQVWASLESLSSLFPPVPVTQKAVEPEIDVDAAFDAFERGDMNPPPHRQGQRLDEIVQLGAAQEPGEEMAPAVAALVEMLRQELKGFGMRLRNPTIVSSRWLLLGELQEMRSKCTQCLEAIAAAILAPLSLLSPDEMLPRYTTEVNRGMGLRAALVDLTVEVVYCNEKLAKADVATAAVLRERMERCLDIFADTSAYRDLWARDKREIIVFRAMLKTWRDSRDLRTMRQETEGFAKFLETLRQINKRPELESHDRKHLLAAQAILQLELGESIAMVHLDRVYGREERLDNWIRARRIGGKPPDERLIDLVELALQGTFDTNANNDLSF